MCHNWPLSSGLIRSLKESLCLTPVISQSSVFEHRIFIESMSTPLLISVSVSSCSDCAVLRLGLLLPSRIKCLLPPVLLGFPVAPVVKKRTHLPVLETWIQYLDWKDPLEEEMATHSSILAWRIPWAEEPGGLQFMGSHSRAQLKRLSTCF